MMKNSKVIIIGAGISGLTAAAILSKSGFSVTVLEKNGMPGGVAGKLSDKGFSFDTGPTWVLMPDVFDNLFSKLREPITSHLKLQKLEPSFKVFFGGNESHLISSDMEKNYQLFDKLEENGAAKLKMYLEDARYKYEMAMDEFLYKEYRSIFDFFTRKIITEGLSLHIFSKLDAFAKRFFKNEKARKILEYNTVFLGCSPYKIPALYSLMSHVDLAQGVYYPRGGIYALVEALQRIAETNGARFYFNESAAKINVSPGGAESVETSNHLFKGDIIVAACDYHHTETALLDPEWRNYSASYWKKRILAPSAFMIYLGLKTKIPSLTHHNLYLADNWERHFSEIFENPAWPEAPSFYVGCPSKTDGSTAPPNGESLMVLVPIAPGLDDTSRLRETYFDKILTSLEDVIEFPVRDHIAVQHIRTVKDFQTTGNLYKGTAMGLAHTLKQTAFFRPVYRNKKLSNLFYTGHYTHPGIGMPMTIISAQIVSDIINKKYHG